MKSIFFQMNSWNEFLWNNEIFAASNSTWEGWNYNSKYWIM